MILKTLCREATEEALTLQTEMSCSPPPPPASPDERQQKRMDGEIKWPEGDLYGVKESSPLSLHSDAAEDFGEADQERPDAASSPSSTEKVKAGEVKHEPTEGLSTAEEGYPDSPVADHASVEAKDKFDLATKEGSICGTFDFAARVLSHASSVTEMAHLDCPVFALQLPTQQEAQAPNTTGFNLLSKGAFCMVSAIKDPVKMPHAQAVGKETSSWRVNFPGQDADESATGIVDGKPVALKYVSGTWELRYLLAPSPPIPSSNLRTFPGSQG